LSGDGVAGSVSVRAAFLLRVAVSLLANIAAAPVLMWQSVVAAGL
jgi:hypothetical protein